MRAALAHTDNSDEQRCGAQSNRTETHNGGHLFTKKSEKAVEASDMKGYGGWSAMGIMPRSSRCLLYPLTFSLAPEGTIDGKKISLLYNLLALGEYFVWLYVFLQ